MALVDGLCALYEVERILAHRDNDRFEYLIRWKGFSPQWDTWEPSENLSDCENIVEAYNKSPADPLTISTDSAGFEHIMKSPSKLDKSTNDIKNKKKNKKLIAPMKIIKKSEHSQINKERRKSKLSRQAALDKTLKSDPSDKMAAQLVKKCKVSVKLNVAHNKKYVAKRNVPMFKERKADLVHVLISKPSPLLKGVVDQVDVKFKISKYTKKHRDSCSKNVSKAKSKVHKSNKIVLSSKIKKKSGRKRIVKAHILNKRHSVGDTSVTESLIDNGIVNFKKIITPTKKSPPKILKCKYSKIKKIATLDEDKDNTLKVDFISSPQIKLNLSRKPLTVNSHVGKNKFPKNTSAGSTKIEKKSMNKKRKTNKGSKEKMEKKRKSDILDDVAEKKKKKTTNSVSVDSDIEDDDSGILYSLSSEESENLMEPSKTKDKVRPGRTKVSNESAKVKPKPKKDGDQVAMVLSESSEKIQSNVIDLKTYPVIDLGEKVNPILATAFKKPQSITGVIKMKSVKPVQHQVLPTPLFTAVKPLTSSMFRPHTITSASALMDEYCRDVPTYHFFPSVLPISPSSMSYKTLLNCLPSQLHLRKSKRKENDMDDEEEEERVERRSSVRQSECAFRYKYIVVKKCEKYTQIWLNSQTKMKNALNPMVIQEVISAFNSAKYDDSNLVMFSGLGNVFCSGIDLDYLTSGDRRVVARVMVDALRDFTKALIAFSKPVVAVVTGPAIGIGMTMLPLCDVVYASDKATFSLPYAQIAQTPEGCATYTLPLAVGMAMTNELLIGGRKITAIEACQLGLVSQVLWPTSIMQEVIPRVQNMALLSGKALETTKLLIRSHQRTKLELTNESECNLLLERWSSPDCQKAIQTYLADEKNFTM